VVFRSPNKERTELAHTPALRVFFAGYDPPTRVSDRNPHSQAKWSMRVNRTKGFNRILAAGEPGRVARTQQPPTTAIRQTAEPIPP